MTDDRMWLKDEWLEVPITASEWIAGAAFVQGYLAFEDVITVTGSFVRAMKAVDLAVGVRT